MVKWSWTTLSNGVNVETSIVEFKWQGGTPIQVEIMLHGVGKQVVF